MNDKSPTGRIGSFHEYKQLPSRFIRQGLRPPTVEIDFAELESRVMADFAKAHEHQVQSLYEAMALPSKVIGHKTSRADRNTTAGIKTKGPHS